MFREVTYVVTGTTALGRRARGVLGDGTVTPLSGQGSHQLRAGAPGAGSRGG
jgi:hypothetical protein